MSHYNHHDEPIRIGRFTVRNPRRVLLLNPFQTPLMLSLFTTSIVFTFWPEMLEHSPVGFETRGFIHHVWHYLLVAGTGTILVGMFAAVRSRLKIELVGILLLVGAAGMNLVATVSAATWGDETYDTAELSGLGLAYRVGVISGLLVRAYIVATEPTVDLPSNGDE